MKTIRALLHLCTCIGLVLTASMLTAQNPMSKAPNAKELPVNATNSSGTPEPQLQKRYPRYVIQREDVLLISFPLSPELNQTVTVQPDGYIDLQSAGSVHIQGMTVPAAVKTIKHAYVGILNHPIVNVDLQDFQKPFFTVTGQVGKPGRYELRSDLTVAEAIAVAGGLESTAKQQVFLFRRTSKSWFKVEKINLKDILKGKHVNEDAILKPGDMVFVPESTFSKFRKYVPYSVNAGSYLGGAP
ncbi:MAG TPA: polysaccharide biosynthesis/export family protein [Terracidiphilus sp.]|nr:polysaccharide biosynthesis/export family protein [Terracidiphilus sp.]